MGEEREQDPRTGAFPLADEANKWGMLLLQFEAAWEQTRTMPSDEARHYWCSPPFHTLMNEFRYVLEHDDKFWQGYEDKRASKKLSPPEMSDILGEAKGIINRERRLWGYDKMAQDKPPSLVTRRNGNGTR